LRYRTLFDISPVGIGLAGKDGRILHCNELISRMLGYPTVNCSGPTSVICSRILRIETEFSGCSPMKAWCAIERSGSCAGTERSLSQT
jgi:hypothetical protein